MIRAVLAQLVSPMTTTITISVALIPKISASSPTMSRMIGARRIASTNVGRMRKKSVSRIRTVSSRPPMKPDTMPISAADDDRDERGQEADRHRDAGPVDGLVEDVPAEVVGSEQVRRARRLERQAGRGRGRLERADEELREQRQQDEEDEDQQPDHAVRPARRDATGEVARVATAQPPALAADVDRERRRAHARTRGSSRPYTRSAARLATMTVTEMSRNTPCSTG